MLDTIQWNTQFQIGNTVLDPCHLAELFASSGISPSVMDAAMSLISIRVANTSSIRRTIVENSRVEWGLRSDVREWDMQGESRELEAFRCYARYSNRWAIFEIDLENQLVPYGDPTGQEPLEIDLQPIQKWLNALGYPKLALRHFEHEFQDDDCTPRQENSGDDCTTRPH